MTRIKDIPKLNRLREKFLKEDPEALSRSNLLTALLGNGINEKNVRKLAQQVIAGNKHHSSYKKLEEKKNKNFNYVADEEQSTLFDLLEFKKSVYERNDLRVENGSKRNFIF